MFSSSWTVIDILSFNVEKIVSISPSSDVFFFKEYYELVNFFW